MERTENGFADRGFGDGEASQGGECSSHEEGGGGGGIQRQENDGTERRIEANKNRAVRNLRRCLDRKTQRGARKGGGKGDEATKGGAGATDGGR